MKHKFYPRLLYFLVALILTSMTVIGTSCSSDRDTKDSTDSAATDSNDSYSPSPTITSNDSGSSTSEPSAPAYQSSTDASAPSVESADSAGTIGFSTGGAKDIENFRENISNGYLPLPTDITYEGLYYDYYFDTGAQETCNKLFCPSYSLAVTSDPYSAKPEYYLAVGLNSGLKQSDFERKKLNLVVVLDISGSMKSPFDSYYYDNAGNYYEVNDVDPRKEKIQVAAESISAMMDHLNGDDLFSIVTFNENAKLIQGLKPVDHSLEYLRSMILDINANGATHLSAGMQMATEQFEELTGVNPDAYENRIIFLTDAMPNTGEVSSAGLMAIVQDNANRGIYTSFIGIGVDFNTELIEAISKIRGANYYSVHSSTQFKERMDNEFEYMVTPLIFDLTLSLEADGWEIEQVYGSPEADKATGEIMYINTLFPSEKKAGQTRGGMTLLKLRQIGQPGNIRLSTTYVDRNGNPDSSTAIINFYGEGPEYFQNTGIQKAVLLARYANLLKDWLWDQRTYYNQDETWNPVVNESVGIVIPRQTGIWERQSMPLVVSRSYQKLFQHFYYYMQNQIDDINDNSLAQELSILDKLR